MRTISPAFSSNRSCRRGAHSPSRLARNGGGNLFRIHQLSAAGWKINGFSHPAHFFFF